MSAVFRVVENGTGECFQTEHDLELLDAARLLRECFQRRDFLSTEMLPAWERIGLEEFHRLAAVRMENTGEVAGAFELDFDRREFSAVLIMDGWQVFSMADVCAAADAAFREEGIDREEQWRRLLDVLDGRALTPMDRLPGPDPFFDEGPALPSGPTM